MRNSAERLTAEDMEYLYGEIDDEVIIEICKQRNILLPEALREEEGEDIYIDDFIPETPAPKRGFFGTLAAIFAGAGAGVSSAKGRRHNRRCNGDCANCPPHYGYRYGDGIMDMTMITAANLAVIKAAAVWIKEMKNSHFYDRVGI